MMVFSCVEIALALRDVFVIFGRDELCWAGSVLRGGGVPRVPGSGASGILHGGRIP
jgi:hypothetical protein